MNRDQMISRIEDEKCWDIIVIGGGCSGVGCAVDAASRGYKVLLLEKEDFGKGTSSRSTKLIHGGVRYLKSGQFRLVKEALQEREILHKNASHIVRRLDFLVPCYSFPELLFYSCGLKLYDLMSHSSSFKRFAIVSSKTAFNLVPTLQTENIKSGVIYSDGQFDDARLLISLVKTAVKLGATVLNYARVFALSKNTQGAIDGVEFIDEETGRLFYAKAKIVINATGAFCDSIRKMSDKTAVELISPSQGAHLVLDKSSLESNYAVLIPKTTDKRVFFAIPWLDRVIIGTTDTPTKKIEIEPKAFKEEVEFLLETYCAHFRQAPLRIYSVFAGIRPLVDINKSKQTAKVSRDYFIEVDKHKLLTLTGGKWTTYRKMAEKTIDLAASLAELPARRCVTKNLKIHGYVENFTEDLERNRLSIYGSDAKEIQEIANQNETYAEQLHENLPYMAAEIVWAVRKEMALTLEDVLSRRTRSLFLDAKAAVEIAPKVARLMAKEMGKNDDWEKEQLEKFKQTAENFLCFVNFVSD
ncbi:MAG: glycerol-3-phosphate dehydrogenase/oxidase [Acidobacteria bacterium]|nr:MAG: glycerol-3-phosphate dehydrogenase/oxidase [Acidobacteriota bacterium]